MQDLHQRLTSPGSIEYKLDIGGHGRPVGLEHLDKVVGVGGILVEVVNIHDHEERHHYVVMAEAKVGASLSRRQPLPSLCQDVVHNGRAGHPIRKILAETLVIINLPKRYILLRGQQAVNVQTQFLRDAVHAAHKHIEIEEDVKGTSLPKGGHGILEQTAQDLFVLRETSEEELF